jgi:hypothetical protein
MDCVFQICNQYPCHFEFNETFLLFILEHLYSCKFGTFLYNSEKERIESGVASKTMSLWTIINNELDNFINPFYVPAPGVLKPTCNGEDIIFWKRYYASWHRESKKIMTLELRGKMFQSSLRDTSERLKEVERELNQMKNGK